MTENAVYRLQRRGKLEEDDWEDVGLLPQLAKNERGRITRSWSLALSPEAGRFYRIAVDFNPFDNGFGGF